MLRTVSMTAIVMTRKGHRMELSERSHGGRLIKSHRSVWATEQHWELQLC